MIVNKPKKLKSGEMQYTITQPLSSDGKIDDKWKGSDLDSQYLEVVDAFAEASEYQLEFRVYFQISGSFFIQIQFEDASGNVAYTSP